MITGLATVATTGKYSNLSGRPSLATVATSGSYNDLSNRPSIPASPNAYVTSTYHSGSSWYRKWSDGFIEQGGIIDGGSSKQSNEKSVTFNTVFSNKNYIVSGSALSSGTTQYLPFCATAKNTSSMTVKVTGCWPESQSRYISWYACGY